MGLVVQLFVFVVFSVISEWQVTGQRIGVLSFGKCPARPEMENFDIKQFSGKWHEVERSFYLMEVASSCTTFTFSPVNETNNVNVILKSVNRWTKNPSVVFGKANQKFRTSSVLKYTVSSILPDLVARGLPGSGTYHILDTDYTNYAIMWTCSNMRLMHTDNLWVLGRTPHLPVDVRAIVYDKLHEANLDSDRLIASKNEHCPAF